MNCDQAQERASEYLEGLLDPGDYQSVQDHLSRCARCHAEVEALSRTIRAVTNLPPLEPPPGFSQKVMAHIREKAERPGIWERLFLPVRIKIPIHAVALLLVSGLALYLYQANRPLEREIRKSIPLESEIPLRQDFQENEGTPKSLPSSPQKDIPVQEPLLKESKTEAIKKGRGILQGVPEQSITAKEEMVPATESDQVAYFELSFTPKEPLEGMKVLAQRLGDLVKQVGGEYLQIDEKAGRLKQDLLLKSQILWLTIPEDHYEQFKTGLSSLGRIDLESKKPDSTIGEAYDTISPSISYKEAPSSRRIKLTILLPEKPEKAQPADQPVK